MTEGYEALRAQATGAGLAPTIARGLALFLRSGLAAWMTAWRQLVAASSSPPPGRLRISLNPHDRFGRKRTVVSVESARG